MAVVSSAYLPGWKKFQFFDKELVKEEGAAEAHQLFQRLDITASTGGRGSLIYGDAQGCINIIDRDFKAQTWQAYDHRVTHLKQLQRRNVIISIGNDEELDPTIKVWHLDRRDKQGNPQLLQELTLTRDKPVPVTCFAVTEQLSHIAVGLADGAVILIAGDILRTRSPKQRVIRKPSGGLDYITGLGFRERNQTITLFCVTNSCVLSYSINDDGSEVRLNELDSDKGAELHCVCLNSSNKYVVLGRSEAVFFFDTEGRGPCFAFEGLKLRLMWFRSYLVIVSANGPNDRLNAVNIYDLKNKLIAYSGSFERITDIAAEWGSVFLLTSDGKLYQLEEKDTQTKLEFLFRRNLYNVALSLALSQKMDQASVNDIFRKHGDHLYDKGDFDGAMAQYVQTLGHLEPSYVIRKYLDAQRIHNLTSYLSRIHQENLAKPDHTTLLLNCYTKLKDEKRLNSFIADDKLHFEVETAIKVCRQAGYQRHALFLARKHGAHDWFLKILLEDLKDYNNALLYIMTLPFDQAEKNVKKYGKILVTHLPERTTDLLTKLCTEYKPSGCASTRFSLDSAHMIHGSQAALEASLTISAPSSSSSTPGETHNRLTDLFMAIKNPLSSSPTAEHKIEQLTLEDIPIASVSSFRPSPAFGRHEPARRANPTEFIHIFVAQTEWLIRFLEFIVTYDVSASSLIYNTLLELYLRQGIPEKCLSLLRTSKAEFNDDHTLILCQMHEFKEGVLFLYERMKLFHEIVHLHMQDEKYEEVVRACTRYGDKDPNLWVMALSYFATKRGEACKEHLLQVLQHVDRADLLPPLLVIEILAQNSDITLGSIQDYITRRLQNENQLIIEDQRRIKAYTEEMEKMKDEIEKLRTTAKTFQNRKCSICNSPLDLPAVHFLCMHSFHQRCLGEQEQDCPVCAFENSKILEIKRSLEDSADQHDQFFKQLEASPDGFSTVAAYFGRCMFSQFNDV